MLPLVPLILGGLGLLGAAGGMGGLFGGIDDLATAKEMSDLACQLDQTIRNEFQTQTEVCESTMETLGRLEFQVEADFRFFVDLVEKISNRPEFLMPDGKATLPDFDFREIKTVEVGVNAFLGAVVGAAGGGVFGAAASSGTTAAVMALGTASTGTAISSLSGAAATNAALAFLGGGAIAAGGGGMALGVFVLNTVAVGVGILVGGVAFAVAGNKAHKKAEELFQSVKESEKIVKDSIQTLDEIKKASRNLMQALHDIHDELYVPYIIRMKQLVNTKQDWMLFSQEEKQLVEDTILIVAVLHKLANTALYAAAETDNDGNVKSVLPNTNNVNLACSEARDRVKNLN